MAWFAWSVLNVGGVLIEKSQIAVALPSSEHWIHVASDAFSVYQTKSTHADARRTIPSLVIFAWSTCTVYKKLICWLTNTSVTAWIPHALSWTDYRGLWRRRCRDCGTDWVRNSDALALDVEREALDALADENIFWIGKSDHSFEGVRLAWNVTGIILNGPA